MRRKGWYRVEGTLFLAARYTVILNGPNGPGLGSGLTPGPRERIMEEKKSGECIPAHRLRVRRLYRHDDYLLHPDPAGFDGQR